MATITIEIPEELSAKLSLIQERLPEVLAQYCYKVIVIERSL